MNKGNHPLQVSDVSEILYFTQMVLSVDVFFSMDNLDLMEIDGGFECLHGIPWAFMDVSLRAWLRFDLFRIYFRLALPGVCLVFL